MTRKTNTQNATGTNHHILGRFSSPALAASYSARTLKASRQFMGDDMKI